MRGVGAVEALRATLPEGAVGAAAALTHLGDPAVLVALVVVVYWRRPDAGRLLVVGLGAVGLVLS
ncbi:MAG: phosphoesterase PA-phosphatase, partial [Halobacteriaceae archaeon]